MRVERLMGPDNWRALPALLRSLYFIPLATRIYNQGHTHSQGTWLKWEEIFEETICEEVKKLKAVRKRSPVKGDFRFRDFELELF